MKVCEYSVLGEIVLFPVNKGLVKGDLDMMLD